MASLVQSRKYGAINTDDTSTNGFYVIMSTSEAYTLQNNKKIDGQMITSVKLFFKAQYICSMQESTNWFCDQHTWHQVITVTPWTILHPKLDVIEIIDINEIAQSVCNRTQAKKVISRNPIFLNDSDYDYILEEIYCRDRIEF